MTFTYCFAISDDLYLAKEVGERPLKFANFYSHKRLQILGQSFQTKAES